MKQNVRPLSSSYTELVVCNSSVYKRTSSAGRTHVRGLFWLQMSCVSSSKTIISSLFADHVSSLYSVTIDSKMRVNTNLKIWRKLCLNPSSEQVSYISKASTRIASLAVSC